MVSKTGYMSVHFETWKVNTRHKQWMCTNAIFKPLSSPRRDHSRFVSSVLHSWCVCKYVNQSWCFMTTQESSNRPFIGLCKCHIQLLIFFRFVSSVLHSKLFKGNYHIYSQVLSQLLHWNGCSPVWVLSWNQLWYCKEKALSHWMHWNGFCPVWVIWCLTRSPLWLKALPH